MDLLDLQMHSSGQYQRQFRKWGLSKSLQSSAINWNFIGQRTEKRKIHQHKDSEVHVNGVLLPPQKLKRAKYREAYTTSEVVFSGGKSDIRTVLTRLWLMCVKLHHRTHLKESSFVPQQHRGWILSGTSRFLG